MILMMNKKIIKNVNLAEKNCCLIRYQMPMLKYCFVFCTNYTGKNQYSEEELTTLFLTETKKLAKKYAQDENAFMFCFSGQSIRKRANFHVHVFIVKTRFEKAVVYSLLATKNWGQLIYKIIKK